MQGRSGTKGDRHVNRKQNEAKFRKEVREQLENQDIKTNFPQKPRIKDENKENGGKELSIRGSVRMWEKRKGLKRRQVFSDEGRQGTGTETDKKKKSTLGTWLERQVSEGGTYAKVASRGQREEPYPVPVQYFSSRTVRAIMSGKGEGKTTGRGKVKFMCLQCPSIPSTTLSHCNPG